MADGAHHKKPHSPTHPKQWSEKTKHTTDISQLYDNGSCEFEISMLLNAARVHKTILPMMISSMWPIVMSNMVSARLELEKRLHSNVHTRSQHNFLHLGCNLYHRWLWAINTLQNVQENVLIAYIYIYMQSKHFPGHFAMYICIYTVDSRYLAPVGSQNSRARVKWFSRYLALSREGHHSRIQDHRHTLPAVYNSQTVC